MVSTPSAVPRPRCSTPASMSTTTCSRLRSMRWFSTSRSRMFSGHAQPLPAPLDGSHHQHANPIHQHAELARNVIHARIHLQEAAPALAAANPLLDQRLQLDQRRDVRPAIAQRSGQVGIRVRVHGHHLVTQVPPATRQKCRDGGLADPAFSRYRDLHSPTSHAPSAAMAGLVELSVSSDSPADSSAATRGSLGMVTTWLNGPPASAVICAARGSPSSN